MASSRSITIDPVLSEPRVVALGETIQRRDLIETSTGFYPRATATYIYRGIPSAEIAIGQSNDSFFLPSNTGSPLNFVSPDISYSEAPAPLLVLPYDDVPSFYRVALRLRYRGASGAQPNGSVVATINMIDQDGVPISRSIVNDQRVDNINNAHLVLDLLVRIREVTQVTVTNNYDRPIRIGNNPENQDYLFVGYAGSVSS